MRWLLVSILLTVPFVQSKSSGRSNRPAGKPSTLANPSLVRLKREWKDAVKDGIAYDWGKNRPTKKNTSRKSHIWIGPLGKNVFRWHFTITGPPGSPFEHGVYHGVVMLPKDYPASPPRVQLLTPSGRFVTGKDICLSASSFHPESWSPSGWTVRTLVESLRLHFCSQDIQVGGINGSYDAKVRLAKASRSWEAVLTNGMSINHYKMVAKGYISSSDDGEEAESLDDVPSE